MRQKTITFPAGKFPMSILMQLIELDIRVESHGATFIPDLEFHREASRKEKR